MLHNHFDTNKSPDQAHNDLYTPLQTPAGKANIKNTVRQEQSDPLTSPTAFRDPTCI